jgi:hypothetical protein
MTEQSRQHQACVQRRQPVMCERILGQLSDYDRGVWTPKPGERVRVATASGDALLGTFLAASEPGRALVFVVDLFMAGAEFAQTYRWDQLAPAPPRDCACPVCSGDDTAPEACSACDCGACPFVHDCGCAGHGCGCPAGGCSSPVTQENGHGV